MCVREENSYLKLQIVPSCQSLTLSEGEKLPLPWLCSALCLTTACTETRISVILKLILRLILLSLIRKTCVDRIWLLLE